MSEARPRSKSARRALINVLVVIGAAISFGAGLAVFLMRDIPFGRLFDTTLVFTALGVTLFLGASATRCFFSRKVFLKGVGVVLSATAVAWTFLTIVAAVDYRALYFRGLPPQPSASEWAEDVRFLADQMKERHADLSSLIDESTLDTTAENIEARISEMSDSRVVMEMFRLAALPNDGHTFPFIFLPSFDLNAYPIRPYGFEEGWFVIEAGREHQDLVGLELTHIGGIPIENVFNDYDLLLSVESASNRRERFAYVVVIAEWLEAHGIIDDVDEARFTFASADGKVVTQALRPDPLIRNVYWTSVRKVASDQPAVFTNPRREHYRFEWLEDQKALYVQYNQCVDQPERESMEAFSVRLAEFIDSHEVERLIVDLRNNDGGDGKVNTALLDSIIHSPKINQRGRLFALIGRRTFSAAVMFTSQLQLRTPVILVGEPTGQGPIFFGGPEIVELPNSKLQFAISRRQTQASVPFDRRRAIMPDIPVATTWQAFRNGRDAALDAALEHEMPVPESAPIGKAETDRFAGRYLLTSFAVLEVEHDGTGFAVHVDDFNPGSRCRFESALYPISPHQFATEIANVTLEYATDLDEHPWRLTLNWMGSPQVLDRAPSNHALPMELFSKGRVEEAVRSLAENRELYLTEFPNLEGRLNGLGYDSLRKGDINGAIRVFQLNVDLFPKSANVWDSLGEAYMENGETEVAIQNYLKSLELNPDSKNAQAMLDRLGHDRSSPSS